MFNLGLQLQFVTFLFSLARKSRIRKRRINSLKYTAHKTKRSQFMSAALDKIIYLRGLVEYICLIFILMDYVF